VPDEGAVYLLGNPSPQMQVREADGSQSSVPAEHLSQSVTRVELAEHTCDPEKVALALSTDNDRVLLAVARGMDPKAREHYALAVYEAEGIVAAHMGGSAPTWVSSDDAGLAKALAAHFGCPIGEPTALLSNGGRDALHEQHLKKSAQPAGFQWGALSASAHTPAAGDTTLEAEITTAGGGLLRAEMTFAHTAGTNTSTLTNTWTANGSDSLPVTITLWGNFNKVTSGGTMGEQDKLSSSATLSASGDSLTVTFTLTAG
jgi:hypothetical protein